MKRIPMLLSVALLLLSALVISNRGASPTLAQDSATVHPLVGAWLADTDPVFTENALSVFTFSADGGYIQVDADGEVLLGQWESTGDSTANLIVVSTESDEEENNLGTTVIRAAIEVAADGQSFSGTYTLELVGPDGVTSGQVGPGTAIGNLIVVEGPGEPVMTMEEMFAMFEGGDAEATPAP